jgi:hypothetical protein
MLNGRWSPICLKLREVVVCHRVILDGCCSKPAAM